MHVARKHCHQSYSGPGLLLRIILPRITLPGMLRRLRTANRSRARRSCRPMDFSALEMYMFSPYNRLHGKWDRVSSRQKELLYTWRRPEPQHDTSSFDHEDMHGHCRQHATVAQRSRKRYSTIEHCDRLIGIGGGRGWEVVSNGTTHSSR